MKYGYLVVPILIFLFFLFYLYSLVHVHQTCDGQVVKNVFDWPVCVH